MPKKKSTGKPILPQRFYDQLVEAEDLLEEKMPAQALEILQKLDKAFPNRPEVLTRLANTSIDLQDALGYEQATRRLRKLSPNDADIALGEAGSLLANLRPALALEAYEGFLRRFPDDPRAAQAHKQVATLQQFLDQEAMHMGLPKDQALDLLKQFEEARFQMEQGLYEPARRAVEKLLKRYPDYVPAINNLSQISALQGNVDRAVELARQGLEKDPQNLHARANLARMLFLNGRMDEALDEANQLKTIPPVGADRWMKLAETFSTLGDEAAVLDLYGQAKRANELEPPAVDAFFYHLLGVSALRMGKEKEARSFWKKALNIDPNIERTRLNLADLEKPPGERSGPWAFSLSEWLLGSAINNLAVLLASQGKSKGKQIDQKPFRQFLEKHPRIVLLIPHLLERGDDFAREFLFELAAVSQLPEFVEPVKAFIFGRTGSLQLRTRGAQQLSDAGLLPSKKVTLWDGNEQRELMLLSFRITREPKPGRMSKAAKSLAEQAYDASYAGDGKRAQDLLEKAIAIQPDEPLLLNNLAMAIEMQGDIKRSHAMIHEIHQRFPDYFFGIVAVAKLATFEGDYERALNLLAGLMERQELHVSEFVALAGVQMDIWLAKKNKDNARYWLDMLEQIQPDHPDLPRYRRQVGPSAKGEKRGWFR